MRRPRAHIALCALALAVALLPSLALVDRAAALQLPLPADFDSSYTEGGYVHDAVRRLVDAWIGPDGAVDALMTQRDVNDFSHILGYELRRYTSDGAPDLSFGSSGVVLLALPPTATAMNPLAVTHDSQGRILIAADVFLPAGSRVGAFRFTPSGQPDATFGSAGVALTPGPISINAMSIVTGPTNRVYVATNMALVAFSDTGVPDPTFATAGTLAIPLVQLQSSATFDALGRIVLVGTNNGAFAMITRVSETGAVVSETNVGVGIPNAVTCLADASCLVSGRAWPQNQPMLAKVTGSGSLDSTFGTSGVTYPDLDRTVVNNTAGSLVSLALQPDGRIVAFASLRVNSEDFGIATIVRFEANGSIDNAFDGGQLKVLDAAFVGANARVQVRPDGKVVGALPANWSSPANIRIGLVRLRGGLLPGPRFHPVSPFRVLDTRLGVGGPSTAFAAGETRKLQVTGLGAVPATGVGAVVLNLTATQTSQVGYLTVFPSDESLPNASNLNFGQDATNANLVVVKVAGDGTVSIFSSTRAHVIVDVSGYFDDGTSATGDQYHPLSPTRVLDTRITTPPGRFNAGTARSLQLAGIANVPAGATAAVINLTAAAPSAASYLTVWPSGQDRPTASNLNFAAGATTPNLVIAKLGSDGSINIYNESGSVDVIVDVVGWYGNGASSVRYYPLAPQRVLDTRTLGADAGLFDMEIGTLDLAGHAGIPLTGACAAILNVTAADATEQSYLTVWPSGEPLPDASSLNFHEGPPVANLVIVGLGEGGSIDVFNERGYVDVIVDVAGWFSCG